MKKKRVTFEWPKTAWELLGFLFALLEVSFWCGMIFCWLFLD